MKHQADNLPRLSLWSTGTSTGKKGLRYYTVGSPVQLTGDYLAIGEFQVRTPAAYLLADHTMKNGLEGKPTLPAYDTRLFAVFTDERTWRVLWVSPEGKKYIYNHTPLILHESL